MSVREKLEEVPLTTVTVSFIAGFSAGSGLGSIATTALGAVGGTGGKRLALAAWPLLKKSLGDVAKESARGFAKDVAESVASKVRSRG